jgi:hypothetical protein
MGTWDIRLYGNDTAADLRDDFRSVVRAPWDGARLLEWALAKYPAAADPSDTDFTDLRLAFADLLWTYGIEHPPAFDLARAVITGGADLAAKRSLGMDDRALARRAKLLDGLRDRWAAPNPKPRARKILARPEAFVLEAGDCLVYPLSKGEARNPYVGPRQAERFFAMHPWTADGWGASIVLARYLKYETFARYIIAVLASDPAVKPEASAFVSLSIINVRSLQKPPVMRRVHAFTTSAVHLERMQVQVVGRLRVDDEKVAAEFSPNIRAFARYGDDASMADKVRVWAISRMVPSADPIARYLASPWTPMP